MASKKLIATAELFLNTKSAKKDAQIFINDLKGKLQDIETAADKMTVFKDMVAYIAQVDKALSALKANNKDAFSHMFDGIDVNLKKQLEGIFGVDGVKLGQLDVLRDSLGNLNLKSSINEIKGFAKELNDLFTSVGIDAPFKDINKDFFGRTNTDHLQRLATELAKFATVWEGLNAKLAEGFNFGGGSGSGGPVIDTNDALSEIQILINTIEKKNKELLDAKERFEKILEEFNAAKKNGISDNYKTDLTTDSVKGLTVEYDNLFKELMSADAASEHFYNTLTKLVVVSLQLKKAFHDIQSNDKLKEQFIHTSAGSGTGQSNMFALLSKYNNLSPVGLDVKKKLNEKGIQLAVSNNNALIHELQTSKDVNDVIQKRIILQDQLRKKIEQHSVIFRAYNVENLKAKDEERLDDELSNIENEIAELTGVSNEFEEITTLMRKLGEEGTKTDDALKTLYKTLGMETPDAFKVRLENLVSESKAAMSAIEGEKGGSGHGAGGSGSGRAGSGGTVTAEVDFTSLENTIRTEAASISDKLDNSTFKVELVNDQTKDIQSAINDIVTNVQQIRDHFHVDQNQTDVNNMKKNLLQLLDVVDKHNEGRTSDGGYQEQELSALLMSDGSFSVNHGDKGRVSWGHVAESLVANLNKTLLGDFHSHPLREFLRSGQTYVNDSFSSSQGDLGAFRFSQSLGAQVAGMITGNILRVLDLSAIPKDTMARMHKELTNIEQQYLNSGRYSQYIGKTEDGRLAAIAQSTLEGRHEVTKVFESMMYDALKRVGYSESYIDNQLFKKYNLTDDAQLTDLATRLVQLVSSAEQAIPPIDRLSEIILQFGGNAIGKDADVLFEAYNKGELKASDVFNDLVPDSRVSEAAIQTLMNINSAGQMSPIETLLTNISSILSNINTIVGNIEANNKLSSEQQLNNAIKDITDLKAGIVNDNLSKGISSIYTGKDATNYRYQDTKIRAATAIKDFTDDLKIKSESDGFAFSESALKDAFELVDKFKTAFTYLQDFGKQTDLLTGGRNNIGLYVEPGSGKILDSYDTLSESLINNDTLNALINYLGSIKENQFSSVDLNDSQQLESVFERLYMVVDDLSSTISNFNGNQSEQKLPKMDDVFDSSNGDNIIDVSHDITNLDTLINKVKEVASEIRGLATEVSNIISNVSNVFKSSQDNIMPVAGDEKSELERLQAQLLEVKAAVDAKTRAFEEEYVTVDGVVESEIVSLQELINKLLEVVRQVGLVETSLKNIGDNSVQLNVGDSEAQLASLLTSSDITKEMSELEALTARVIEVKNAVLSKTKAFVDEGNVVGQVVGKEISALMKLEGIVNGVATKVDVLTTKFKGINKEATSGSKVGQTTSGVANKQTAKSSKDASPVDAFANNLRNQKNAFNEYREGLRDVDYLSAELRAELDRLGVSLQQVGDQSGLDAFKKDLESVKKEISIKKAAHETSGLGSINSAKKSLNNIFNNLTFEQRDGVKKEYDEAIEQLERYAVTVKDGKTVELQAINDTTAALLQKLETIKQANQAVKDAEKAQEKNATFGDTAMINAKAKYNTLDQAVHGDRFKDSRAVIAAWEEYVLKYKELERIQDELSKKPSITSDDEAKFKAAKDACNDYAKSLNKMLNDSTKLSGEKANKADYMLGGDFNYDDENARKAELEEFVKTIDGANIASMQFKKGFKEAMFEVDNGDGTVTKMTAKFTAARNEIVAMAGDTKKTTGLLGKLWTEFKGKVQSIFTYLTASFSLHEVWSVIKQGINYVREIDSALTELKKVTDGTDESYKRFLQTASKTASEVGSTVSSFVDATADFARLGYNIDQAANLAKVASVYKNVGDGIDDVATASESIISTMKAFGIEANDAMNIVDRFNEVGNNFAISSTGIGEAMQRSASALYEAGNTIDESIALITGANSVIQNPEQVGTALKTLALRLRGAKVELEEAGEDVDGMAESTSQLQAKLKALTHGKVDIMLDANTFKNTTQILREMSEAWDDMTDIERSSALELMGGKRQANILASVIKNFDTVEDVIKTSSESFGSAIKENEAYLDSIQGRIDLFNNSLQTMWMNLISSDVVKGIVDLGTELIKLVDTLGLIPTALTVFAGFKLLKQPIEFISDFNGALKGTITLQNLSTAAGQKKIATDAQLAMSTGLASSALVQYAITQGIVTAEQVASMTTTQLLGVSFKALALQVKQATVAMLKFLFTTPAGWAVLAVTAITAVIAAYNAWGPTHKNFIKQLEEETEAFKEVQAELKNVQSELETTRDRIDELQSKGTLSFVEEEELNRLKEQTAELERQEAILQAQEKRAKQKQVEAALKAIETDPNLKDTVVSASNTSMYAAASGANIGGHYVTMTSPYAAAQQNPTVQQDVESDVQNLGNEYDRNLQSLLDATQKLEEAKRALFESPEDEGLQDAVKDAEDKVLSYNERLDELDKTWQEKYGDVGFIENATTEQEKAWNEFYRQHQDYLDQQALINGTYGESKVLDRIFGATATDIAKGFKEKFNEAVQNGENPVQVIEGLLNSGNYDALLTDLAEKFGITKDEIVGYFTQVGQEIVEQVNSINSVSTYSKLVEEVDAYNEALAQTEEIISDNTKVTQEYKDSLTALGISASDLNECFDENDKLVVKDAKALNDLVRNAKKNTAQNIKLAKSQARLDYYELYKKMHKVVDETKDMDDTTRDYVDTLYDQMTALEKVMGKYTILEAELLGVSNAYDKLADAQSADEAMDYGSKAEELVNVLGDAIVTKQLGTEAAKVAIEGLIPQSFLKDAETAEEKMAAIYKYFTSGPISQLFTLEFDDEGAITSVEMAEDNLKNFINSSDVFDGTWDNFTLDPAIQTMEDFMAATGMTREMAFAFFTELEKYDLSWLEGNYNTIMDRLMSDNLEYGIYNVVQQMADLDYQLANGVLTANKYAEAMSGLNSQSSLLGDAAVENTLAWEENQKALDEYIGELTERYELLNGLTLGADGQYRDSSGVIVDPAQVYAEIEEIQGYVEILQGNLSQLQEPTEVVMQFAVDKLQTDMNTIEERVGDLVENTHYIFSSEKNQFIVSPTLNTNDPRYQEILSFVDLLNKQYTIETQMGGDAPTTADQLQTIADSLNDIVTLLMETFGFKFDENGALVTIESIKTGLESIPEEVRTTWKLVNGTGIVGPAGLPVLSGATNAQGNAFANGSIGASKTETALMGELGPELLVRGSRWTTVGDNGAEFTQVKKGDIIFNHKQTEELLKNGRTASRGKLRGSAFASGTAYAHVKDTVSVNRHRDEISMVSLDGAMTTIKSLADAANAASQATQNAIKVLGNQQLDGFKTGDGVNSWHGGNLPGDYSNQTEGTADEPFEDVLDWIEILMEEHEEVLSKLNAQLENAVTWQEKNNKINEMIARNQKKLADSEAGADYYENYAAKYLSQIPTQYQAMAKNGSIAITDFVGDANEEVVEAIQKYRDYIQKAADLNQQAEEILTEIRDLAIQKIDNAYDAGSVRVTIEEAQNTKLQNAIDYDEESGLITSEDYYRAMMANSTEKIKHLTDARNAMQAALDEAVKSGQIVEGSNEWYEQIEKMYGIDAEIDEATLELEQFQNAINEIHWENFDQLISRIDYLKEETQSLIDLMANDDLVADPVKRKYDGGTAEYWTADDVQWTDEGLASLGLYAQQMEIAEYAAKQYSEAIKDLDADYAAGLYSENEYLEKMNELKSAQYENIDAYYEARDAIVELNEARIDSVKDGISKEIEAFEELINAKKKALDTEKD